MKRFWNCLAHWLARKATAAERERLDRFGRMIGLRYAALPIGSRSHLVDALGDACEHTLPMTVQWEVRQETDDTMSAGHVRIVVMSRVSF